MSRQPVATRVLFEVGAVKDGLKNLVRPLYEGLVRLPPVRAVVRRELSKLAGEPWSAAVVDDFVSGGYGAAYGVDEAQREELVAAFRRNVSEIESGTSPLVHIVLAREILSIPREVEGDVIECGVWKGASTASLSLVCEKVGRKLLVCDSFEGLPDDGLELHTGIHTKVYGYYEKGMFLGTEEEVRGHVERWGNLDVCEFVRGFFSESLKGLKGPLVFAFLDVDLVGSMQDCLRAIWPVLVEKGAVYTDDAGDMAVMRVFFDEAWWQEYVGCSAPGVVGTGCGLPLNPEASSLAYTRKMGAFDAGDWKKVGFLHYPD